MSNEEARNTQLIEHRLDGKADDHANSKTNERQADELRSEVVPLSKDDWERLEREVQDTKEEGAPAIFHCSSAVQ